LLAAFIRFNKIVHEGKGSEADKVKNAMGCFPGIFITSTLTNIFNDKIVDTGIPVNQFLY